MIPIQIAVYSDLDQKTEQTFREITPEYSGLSFVVEHARELNTPQGRIPVLITGDPRRLALAREKKFRTVFCADAEQLDDSTFDVLWPAEESLE